MEVLVPPTGWHKFEIVYSTREEFTKQTPIEIFNDASGHTMIKTRAWTPQDKGAAAIT